MLFRVLKWSGLVLLAGLTLLVASSCTMLGLNSASLDTVSKPAATPALDIPRLMTPGGRAEAMQLIEDTLYGPWPRGLPVQVSDWQVINPDYLDGRGTLEALDILIGQGEGARGFQLVAAFPANGLAHPLLLSQTFSSNCAVFPGEPVRREDGDVCTAGDFGLVASMIVPALFGEYIAEAPVGRYFDSGLVYASFHAGDFIPDSAQQAPGAMAGLGARVNPTGTLMAWAFAFSAAIDVLEDDPRVDPRRTSIIGHSRHGKAALLAAIWDPRIEAAIVHQSGFAGASLSRSVTGERLERMAETYPHWLAPGARRYGDNPELLAFDQHLVLALIAPRRVFLGNARRDVWSDPNSAFRSAQAASAMWEAFGLTGLSSDSMLRFNPADGLVWWLRPGGHSMFDDDIQAFVAFLNAGQVSPPELPTRARAP